MNDAVTVSIAAGPDVREPEPPAIDLTGMTQVYRSKSGERTAVSDLNLSIAAGEFVSMVGPSGCGKSTVLYAIAGLRPPSRGSVRVLGAPITGGGTPHPDVGFVFQRDALLPWRTALQNVALGLRYRGVARREALDTAGEWLGRVGLRRFADSYPHQLSGGMRKRVAIAASLVLRPKVLLMDEPFSALDVQTRNLMENDLLRLWEETRQTVLFVTHDLEEAVGLSDRVVTLTAGPGRLLTDRAVPLPRPRDLLEARFDPAFTAMHEQLWDDLRAQVMAAGTLPGTGGTP